LLHTFGLFAVLFGTWILLSGHFTPFLMIAGAICVAFTVYVTFRMDLLDHQRDYIGPVWRLPVYWLWLAGQILVWSIIISSKVLAPRLNIDPAFERVPCTQKSDLWRVLYANSITLTPGTLSTNLRNGALEVHALTQSAMSDLKTGKMDQRITAAEGGKPTTGEKL